MRRVLTAAFWVFAACYVLGLCLLAVGTFGLFGQARDPLSGVFIIPLGWPWLLAADTVPEPMRPWAAILAPLINLAILGALVRMPARPR